MTLRVYEWVKADGGSNSSNFTAWALRQPDNSAESEDCAMLRAPTLEWNDLTCEKELPHVVEFDCTITTANEQKKKLSQDGRGALGALAALVLIMVLVIWAVVVYKRKKKKKVQVLALDPPAGAAAAGSFISDAALPSPPPVPVFALPKVTISILPSYKDQCGHGGGPPIVDAVLVDYHQEP
jgi:hypothetical protein